MPTVQEIKTAVADQFDITVTQIESGRRLAAISHARQIGIYLVRRAFMSQRPEFCSYNRLARWFGITDHTSARTAVARIQTQIETDGPLADAVHQLAARLGIDLNKPLVALEVPHRRGFSPEEQAAIAAAERAGRVTRIVEWPDPNQPRRGDTSWGYYGG